MARGKQITKQINKSVSECLETFLKHCQTKNLSTSTLIQEDSNKLYNKIDEAELSIDKRSL